MKKLTEQQRRAVAILRTRPNIMARDFGSRMWPESARKTSRVGRGSTRGVGVGLKAAGWLRQLEKKGIALETRSGGRGVFYDTYRATPQAITALDSIEDEEARARDEDLLKESGPYAVQSCADGTLKVKPAWGQFEAYTNEEGGGPGLLSRLALAVEVERLLNG